MAKRFNNPKNDKKLERTITRNWIICIVSGILIVVLTLAARG
ncbi:MAG: hypothetical protein ACI4QY_02155 [Oscillospiraceae bacterium]